MIDDLYPSRTGQKAELVPRLDRVVYAGDRNGCPIESERIKTYEEQGFMVFESLFAEEEVDAFQRELDRLSHDEDVKGSAYTITEPGSGEVRSVFKVHAISAVFNRLAADERLAGLAAYLLGDDVYIHQSRVNYKPGFRGKEFYWHSDFETWHVEDGMPRMRALSMSIALTENFDHNGALMLIPGSHRRFAVCEGQTPANHFKSSLKKQEYGVPSDDILRELADKGGVVTATGRPGSVTVFDCNTMHGSNGNITPFARSNVFFVYNALSNCVRAPYGGQAPRPEYICSREHIEPIHSERVETTRR